LLISVNIEMADQAPKKLTLQDIDASSTDQLIAQAVAQEQVPGFMENLLELNAENDSEIARLIKRGEKILVARAQLERKVSFVFVVIF
jgi:hypothetical protein